MGENWRDGLLSDLDPHHSKDSQVMGAAEEMASQLNQWIQPLSINTGLWLWVLFPFQHQHWRLQVRQEDLPM